MKAIIISFVFSFLILCGCANESNPTKSEKNPYSYELVFQFSTLDGPNALLLDDDT